MNSILKSLSKNKVGIIIILMASLFTTGGQYFWKISHMSNMEYLFIGFVLYGFGAIAMILAFRFGSFSVIHPMMSMGYIFTLLVGYHCLGEVINSSKIIGLILIMIGVVFIGVGDE